MTIKVGGARPHPQNGVLKHKGGAKPEATTSGFHVGSGRPLGAVHHGVPPRQYSNHGGTDAKMGVLKRRK
jgi:hypothetical protein